MNEQREKQTPWLRYAKQLNLSEIGLAGQQLLKTVKILCVGAGGLGCPALLYLSAAGVGTIGIADNDQVDITNLHRQILYNTSDINRKKIVAAKEKLISLNPEIEIILHEQKITLENTADIVTAYDIVLDGTDNFETHYLLNDICFSLKKPLILASILKFEGQCAVFDFKKNNTTCYRCLFPAPPKNIPDCNEAGVLGVLPGVIGCIQATEAIKYILDIGESLKGKLLTFNALSMQFSKYNLHADSACLLCAQKISLEKLPRYKMNACENKIEEITPVELHQHLQQSSDIQLIDVREPFEYEICQIGGKLIPLGELASKIKELSPEKLTVVHCRSGGRSAKAVEFLKQNGFKKVFNLKGGIIGWIDQVDSTLTKY